MTLVFKSHGIGNDIFNPIYEGGQCGIKCLVGCDHKNKTKTVCENLMHNRGYRGDIIHNP